MMHSDIESLEPKIDALRKRYLPKLRLQLQKLKTLAEQSGHSQDLAAGLHQVIGTSGCYGFLEVSNALTQAQDALRAGVQKDVLKRLDEALEYAQTTGAKSLMNEGSAPK